MNAYYSTRMDALGNARGRSDRGDPIYIKKINGERTRFHALVLVSQRHTSKELIKNLGLRLSSRISHRVLVGAAERVNSPLTSRQGSRLRASYLFSSS